MGIPGEFDRLRGSSMGTHEGVELLDGWSDLRVRKLLGPDTEEALSALATAGTPLDDFGMDEKRREST